MHARKPRKILKDLLLLHWFFINYLCIWISIFSTTIMKLKHILFQVWEKYWMKMKFMQKVSGWQEIDWQVVKCMAIVDKVRILKTLKDWHVFCFLFPKLFYLSISFSRGAWKFPEPSPLFRPQTCNWTRN